MYRCTVYIWCVYGHAFVAWDSLASPLKNASPSGNVGKKKELSDIGAMHRSFPDLEDLHLAHHLSYSLWDFTVLSAFKMSFRLSSVSKSPSVPSGRVLLDPLGPLRSEGDDARGLALHRLGDGRRNARQTEQQAEEKSEEAQTRVPAGEGSAAT